MKNFSDWIRNIFHGGNAAPNPWGRGSMLLLLTFLLAGCSLYLDEVPDAEADPKDDVEGYNEPVHLETDEYEMTYQFKDSTLVISDRIKPYLITIQEVDSATYDVFFDGSMPPNLLPVVGGYIHCDETDELPYLAHKVESVEQENGMWHVVAKYVSPFEIFEEIAIDGVLSLDAYEDPENGIYLAPRTEAEEIQRRFALTHYYTGTRIDPIDWDSRNVFADGLILTKSFPSDRTTELRKNDFDREDKDGGTNWITTAGVSTAKGPFLQFGLKLLPYIRIYYNSNDNDACDFAVGLDGRFIIAYGFQGEGKVDGDLFEPIMIYGKSLKVGPLKIGAGLSFTVHFELSGQMNFGVRNELPFGVRAGYRKKANEKVGKTYHTGYGPKFEDLLYAAMPQLGVLIGDSRDISGTMKFNVMPRLTAGIGFGGKIPSSGVSEASLKKLIDAGKIKKEDLDPSTNEVGAKINLSFGPELTVNLLSPFNNVEQLKSTNFFDAGLYAVLDGSLSAKILGFTLLDENFTLAKVRVPGCTYTIPSVPTIDNNSFFLQPSAEGHEAFTAEYKVKDIGLWGAMGLFRPKLNISQNGKTISNIDNAQGVDLDRTTRHKTFTFGINEIEKDKTYLATPELVFEGGNAHIQGDAIPFATQSPSMAVVWIEQTDAIETSDKSMNTVAYTFKYRTKVAIRGSQNIESWGVTHSFKLNRKDNEDWTNKDFRINKLDKRDRSYYIDFTLRGPAVKQDPSDPNTTKNLYYPTVRITPWAQIVYDGSGLMGDYKDCTLDPGFVPIKEIEGGEPDASFAKGYNWGVDEDGVSTPTDGSDWSFTIDSVTPVDE